MMFHSWNVYVPGLTPLPSSTKNSPNPLPGISFPTFLSEAELCGPTSAETRTLREQ